MPRLLPLFLAALLVLGGCDALQPSGAVRLEASASAYSPGDEAYVSLQNGSSSGIGFNLCLSLDVEAREGGRWVPAHAGTSLMEGAACQAILYGLAPGERAEARAKIPSGIAPGTYRLATEVEAGGRRRRVASRPFDVR